MDYIKIRELVNKGVRLDEIELRVTYYARVSSLKDEQLNSLDNQVDYYENYIKRNSNWKYIRGYVDEGISGSSVKNRKEFLNMIEDAKLGLFDLIITKEVSRFSRNLYDSIKYTQELLKYNVGIFFETNNINTFDNNSEFILNLMSSLAQEEVKRLSSRIKWGAKNAQKRGRVLGAKTFGYKKKNGILEIDYYESEIVKLIFDLYVTNNYGVDKISFILGEKGIYNSKGNLYDASTIKRIIRNPKYKGYYQGHTTEVIDYKTKRRIKVNQDNQVIFKTDAIPAIVSEDVWDSANKILNSRHKYPSSNVRKYIFSGILYCANHNKVFIRSTGSKRSKNVVWACNNYMKYRLKACASPLLKEIDLIYIFRNIFADLYYSDEFVFDMEVYYKIDNISERMEKIDKAIKRINELYVLEYLSKEELEIKLGKLNKQKEILLRSNNLWERIKEYFYRKDNIDLYVNYFIEKIYVNKINGSRKDILLDVIVKNIDVINKKEYSFEFLDINYKLIIS